jgi:gluconokinase
MSMVIAVDVGTSSTRGAVYKPDLEKLTGASVEYASSVPRPLWAQQDPERIYQAVLEVVKECVKKVSPGGIEAVTIDTALHSVIGLDENKTAITPMLTWEDLRADYIVNRWKEDQANNALYELTGCVLHPMYPLAKIAWFKEQRPEVFRRIRYFVSVKAYLLYRLTGQLAEEESTASGSGLLNVTTLKWESKALELLGIDERVLAPLIQPTEVLTGIRSEVSLFTGLSLNTKVVAGCSDAAMSSLGSGTIYPEQMTVMVGTSGAARRVVDKPVFDRLRRTWCYYVSNNKWIAGGAINNGGNILRWFRDNFAGDIYEKSESQGVSPYDILSGYAEEVPAGADGLLFLPFLAGERSPFWNAKMRGIVMGLTLHHGPKQMVRALMEGVMYQIKSVCQPLEELVGEPKQIRGIGGFARSKVWVQIMADILDRSINLTAESEGSILGAAALAFYALGQIDSFDVLLKLNPVKHVVEPSLQTQQVYRAGYEKYIKVYHLLKEEFSPIEVG